MKLIKFLPLVFIALLTACNPVKVNSDYDKSTSFEGYKTYAYQKGGIDKVEISDLDKKRILRSIDEVMAAKGFTKSENPDLLINFFTKEREQINVTPQYSVGWQYGWSYGWNPWTWPGHSGNVSKYTEGTLTIDFIDAKKNELIWQGIGEGSLTKDVEKKDENIKEFVTSILNQYPPGANKK